ncbi:MAG: type II toxin-antitoxin system VapC family toxin [Candidatus Aminicenantes bacterium]|nr:type II toxin-antitoxin system VapC family toxin [Candidatus Aminicenantes bacterium]
MKACVIDSSVAVKWFCEEAGTAAALVLRDEACAGRRRLAAPDLLFYEIGNALRYNARLDAEDVKLALASLLDLGIDFRPPGVRLLSRAVDLAFRFGMTVYDGCFVALAGDMGAPLITADEKLVNQKSAGHPRVVRLSDAPP